MAKARRNSKEPSFQVIDPNANYSDNGVPQPEPYIDLSRAYGAHVWVYRCVSAIATNIAGVEILPYLQKKDGSWIVDERHEILPLLRRPNPYMSGYQLREYTAASRRLTGNAYWYLETLGTNEIKEIWPLLPSNVRVVASKEKMIDHYVYRVGGVDVSLPYDQVIQFQAMNPESFIYGMGSLTAAKNAVATDIFAQVWNKSFFKNSARPDGTLETDKVLAPDVRQRIKESWNQMYQGAAKHGNTAILEGGLKYSRVSENAKDMDFVNLRKDLRIEILAAFGVPPSVVGLLEFANYSNMEQQSKMFWENTLLPDIRSIEDTLTMRVEQISFRMGSVFQADLSKVQALQRNMKEAAETFRTFVDGGVPPNQVIDALDLPFQHYAGGDESRQPPAAFGGAQQPKPEPAKAVKALEPDAERETIRAVRWKRLDEKVRESEGRMRVAMKGFFSGQRRRVLKQLDDRARSVLHSAGFLGGQRKNAQDTIHLIFNLEQENDLMAKAAGKIIRGTYFEFAVNMARQSKPDFNFNLSDPIAEAWISKKVSKLVREANAYTLESISSEVADAVQEAAAAGFTEGESISAIADRITAVYDFADDTRAERIARTEVIGASNAGSFDGMKQAGIQRKEWLSSRDSLTRETHMKLDGQEVGISEPFRSDSGALLQFPGDPEGPPEEIINCRCTPVAVVDR